MAGVMKKVSLIDELRLPIKRACFVVEYMKDFAPRRAAEASGFASDKGYALLKEPEVVSAIEYIIQKRLEVNQIDADWLLFEMIDNHMIARQNGNLAASNRALSMVGKHKRVDAFAADKIKVSTDADVVDRLVAARRRISARDEPDEDEVSFI